MNRNEDSHNNDDNNSNDDQIIVITPSGWSASRHSECGWPLRLYLLHAPFSAAGSPENGCDYVAHRTEP